MPTARYSPVQLWRLWIANGGSRKAAPVAVAVALAESRGNPNARHYNRNSAGVVTSVDQGLWQINSSNYSGSDIYDPNVNARWAIRLSSHGRGWRNWTTYTSGKYKKYLPKGEKGDASGVAGKNFGIFTQANYAGTDQGVDYKGSGPIPALASGTVTDVGKASIIEGGQFPYVVYRLNSGPYKGHYVYVAENFVPTVKRGTKLKVGQEVGKAVGSYPYIEVGFNKTAKGWNPSAPLNPNPHSPKPAGEAMKAYIDGIAHLHPGVVVSGAAGLGSDLASAGSTALSFATNPVGGLLGLGGDALSSVTEPIAKAIDRIGTEIAYAGAILGGGIIFILGLVLLAADVGLSTKAGKVTAAAGLVVATKGKAAGVIQGASAAKKTSEPESNIPDRKEQRAEEKHQAQLKNIKARTKATKSQAKNRKKTVKEQKASEQKSYYAGARDAASPTMAKIRRERGKKKST